MSCRRMPLLPGLAALWLIAVAPDGARADTDNDINLVQTQVSAFFEAIAARDVTRMQALWALDDDVAMLTPGQRRPPAIGWRAVRAAFLGGAFTYWNAIKAAPDDYPLVTLDGTVAFAAFRVRGVGSNRWGESVPFTIRVTQQFRKAGGRWLLTGSWGVGKPE